MSSLQESDREAAVHAVAPRVTLADIEAAIGGIYYGTAFGTVSAGESGGCSDEHSGSLSRLTLCVAVMRNGFTVIGKSAPASPENFDAEFGRKLAYEDCIRQLWPLMGFALRDKLAAQAAVPPRPTAA